MIDFTVRFSLESHFPWCSVLFIVWLFILFSFLQKRRTKKKNCSFDHIIYNAKRHTIQLQPMNVQKKSHKTTTKNKKEQNMDVSHNECFQAINITWLENAWRMSIQSFMMLNRERDEFLLFKMIEFFYFCGLSAL